MGILLLFALMTAPGSGVVIVPVANMHAAPSGDAELVSQAILGTTIGFSEDNGGWSKVRTPDDYTGWIQTTSLRRLRDGEAPYASVGRIAQVDNLFANLYREPDLTKHAPLLTVPFEARLDVVSEERKNDERWIEVRLPDGRNAWVQRGDVTFDLKPLNVESTIALAKRFLGLPYLWGGASAFGFDCSGFTQMLYRHMGVVIPRDSRPQAAWDKFRAVDIAALQPGDLLYFGSSLDKVTHTGMYIGGGEFIHATTHERPVVQISRLADPHWTKLLVACRRLK
ncbi:MAG: NlpC/P60 family protein [Bryobacteraceae bacterium]